MYSNTPYRNEKIQKRNSIKLSLIDFSQSHTSYISVFIHLDCFLSYKNIDYYVNIMKGHLTLKSLFWL